MNDATEHFEHEYRLRTKSGHWIWVRERAKVVERTPDGHPLRVVGAHMDITGRRQTEEVLRAQKERLKAALSASKTGTYRWDIGTDRSEEHTSELQSLMRISYAVFCLKKKKTKD